MPRRFGTNDGETFSHVQPEVKTDAIVASKAQGSTISITFQDPIDPARKDMFLFIQKDRTHAELKAADFPLPPFALTRAAQAAAVTVDWDPSKTYSVDDGRPSNPEMKRIFDEDQRVRQPGTAIDWAQVGKTDAERREATKKLLNEGSLHTAQDFGWAAFLFQHGSVPGDYLLAHTLAMIAVAKGDSDAMWIATATLDRYLQSVHQPQIYGTQFFTPKGQPVTQEPYDRSVISDALRKQLGVPVQKAQEEQRKQYEAQRPK